MGTLPDHQIRFIQSYHQLIEPFDPAFVQPCSYDVHLDKYFRRLYGRRGKGIAPAYSRTIDPRVDNVDVFEDLTTVPEMATFTLEPGEFVLASTYEIVRMPENILARFEGKSSLARLGLLTHITAGFIDPGFKGSITLELKNVTDFPVVLVPGMPIGQLSFEMLDYPVGTPYGSRSTESRYQFQNAGPVLSRVHMGFKPVDVYEP